MVIQLNFKVYLFSFIDFKYFDLINLLESKVYLFHFIIFKFFNQTILLNHYSFFRIPQFFKENEFRFNF